MLTRNTCPITGQQDLVTVINLPFHEGVLAEWARSRQWFDHLRDCAYRVLYNPSIDFYFQSLVFSEEEEQARRSAEAANAGMRPRKQDFSLTELCHKAEDAILIRLLCRHVTRPRVLDFGMGDGSWALMAKAFGSDVTGLDIDPRSSRFARANDIAFSGVDALKDGFFDFVNADQVFEHLCNPLEVLKSLVPKIAPGGFVKISTPHSKGIESKLKRLENGAYHDLRAFNEALDEISPLIHINLFSARSLKALGRAAGLKPFAVPLGLSYGTMVGFHTLRQLNRNLYYPWKRHRARKCWQYFQKEG
jgi:SAM-dependent methyltransferase